MLNLKIVKLFSHCHSWQQKALNPVQQQSPFPQLSSLICVNPVPHFPSQNGAVPSQTQFDGVGDGALKVAVVLVVMVVLTAVVLVVTVVLTTWTLVVLVVTFILTAWTPAVVPSRCAASLSIRVPPTAPPTVAPITIRIIIMITIIPSLRR